MHRDREVANLAGRLTKANQELAEVKERSGNGGLSKDAGQAGPDLGSG